MSDESQKSECLSLRISTALKLRLQRIARSQHQSMSFVAVKTLEKMVADMEAQDRSLEIQTTTPVIVSPPAKSVMRWLKFKLTRTVMK